MPSPHEQLLLWDRQELDGLGSQVSGEMDVSFLHKSFCVAGLPLRAPKRVMEPWTRNDDKFALTVSPHKFMLPGGKMVEIGVPFGPKARLLAMWMATEIKDPTRAAGDRWLEIGKVTSWLRTIGIAPVTGRNGSLNAVKEQLVRLAFSQITMVMRGGDGDVDGHALFKSDRLIDGGLFRDGDLELYADGKHGQMTWPKGVLLSERAYDRFSRHAIPVPTARLARIAHSAMALDIFTFLCYRLPLLSPEGDELVRWRQLIAHFGSGEAPSKFRETFETSIRAALDAYPEANISLTEEGLRMAYSDPAALRRAFMVVPKAIPASAATGGDLIASTASLGDTP